MTAVQPQPERDWRQEPLTFDRYHFELIFAVIAIIAAILIGRALFAGDDGYWSNVYMTVLGVVITILVLDRQAERREQQREERELKAQLVRDAGSSVNEIAKNAVDQIRKRGWLTGDTGILAGVDLVGANLQDANLKDADLQGMNLERANLQGANLVMANLKEANLWYAKLQGASLIDTNFQRANLGFADLQGAILFGAKLQGAVLAQAKLQQASLWNANLQGANLMYANLQGAGLEDAKLENADFGQGDEMAHFDEKTRLPDGTRWTPDTDLTRFTAPKPADGG